MSHFTVGVVINKEDIDKHIKKIEEDKGAKASESEIEDITNLRLHYNVDKALTPFDENLEVDEELVMSLEELRRQRDKVINYNGECEWDLKMKKMYQDTSLEDFCNSYFGYNLKEDGAYARYNTKGKWDWYVIGGRWNATLPIKNYVHNKEENEKYDGYGDKIKGNACKIKDLVLHKDLNEEDIELLRKKYEKLITEGNVFYKAEYMLRKYPTFELYLKDTTTYNTYALLTSKGEWIEPGEMGWFGCSSAKPEEEMTFIDIFVQKLQEEDPDNYFVLVDCHV